MKFTMKYLLSAVILLVSISMFGRNGRMAVDANVPFPVGGNFLTVTYNGVFDLGFRYDISKHENYKLGVSGNIAYLDNKFSKTNVFIFRPRVYLRYEDEQRLEFFMPYLAFGYGSFRFTYPGQDGLDAVSRGPNVTVGGYFHFTEQIYLMTSYDYMYLPLNRLDEKADSYNLHVLSIGFGYRF